MKIFVFFSLLLAFGEPLKLENIELSKMAVDFAQGYRISIKDIINGLKENFVGHKKTNFSLIEIDPENRLEDIVIESNVPDIFCECTDDSLRKIDIKNLTIPISLLNVRGEYFLEGISLFDLLIYGQGDIEVNIVELKIFLSMTATLKASTGWKVSRFDIDTSVKNSHIRLNNLMNGEPMGDFLNFMIDELFRLGVDLLNGIAKQFEKDVFKVLEQILNSILSS